MRVITLTAATLGLFAVGCKSPVQSSQLKDDILVKDTDSAVLYWLASDGKEQHVCRAICPEDKIVVQGDVQATRNSCDTSRMESIPSSVFSGSEELKGLFSIFTQNLVKNKVAVLSTDVKDEKLQSKNKERIAKINALYTDETMYLDANVRSLRDQGLVGFGEENVKRHHPACLDSKAVTTGSVATNVGQDVETDEKDLKQPKIVADTARMLFLTKSTYETILEFLKSKSEGKALASGFKIVGNQSLGNEFVWLVNGSDSVKIAVSGDRGPVMIGEAGGKDTPLYLNHPDAHAAWSEFADSLYQQYNTGSGTFGTQITVANADVQMQSFVVRVSVPEGNSFSSPGERKETAMRLTPFKDEAKGKFAIQFDTYKEDETKPNPAQ